MTAAERAKKKRLKTTLFPEKAASQRAQHAEAERRRYHEQWGDGETEQQQLFPESPEGGAEGGGVGGISAERSGGAWESSPWNDRRDEHHAPSEGGGSAAPNGRSAPEATEGSDTTVGP